MTPEISEFSYGFALTNEIVSWTSLSIAPIFPTLVEEGKAGGGYDVKIDSPGVPLFLQFKRSDCMSRKSAKEISDYKLSLNLPFYRFKITERRKSDQHDLLLALDNGQSLVYYAAPRFSRLEEINAAWSGNLVASKSIFLAPTTIGPLDDQSHHIAFDDYVAYLCSQPKRIEYLKAQDLMLKIKERLQIDDRPLRQKIPELVEQLSIARVIAARTRSQRDTEPDLFKSYIIDSPRVITAEANPLPARSGRRLTDIEAMLRRIADDTARDFGAQFIIVQSANAS